MDKEKLAKYILASNKRKSASTPRDPEYTRQIMTRAKYFYSLKNPAYVPFGQAALTEPDIAVLSEYLSNVGTCTKETLLDELIAASQDELKYLILWLVCFAMESGQDAAALFRGDMGPEDDVSNIQNEEDGLNLSKLAISKTAFIKATIGWDENKLMIPNEVFEMIDDKQLINHGQTMIKFIVDNTHLGRNLFMSDDDEVHKIVLQQAKYYSRYKRRAHGLFGQMDWRIQDDYDKFDLIFRGVSELYDDWLFIIQEREGRYTDWVARKIKNQPGLVNPGTIGDSLVARSWMNFLPDAENAYESKDTKVYKSWGDRNPSYSIKHTPTGFLIPTPLTHIGKFLHVYPDAKDEFASSYHRMYVEPYIDWLNKELKLDPTGWNFDHHGGVKAAILNALRGDKGPGSIGKSDTMKDFDSLVTKNPSSIPYAWMIYLDLM